MIRRLFESDDCVYLEKPWSKTPSCSSASTRLLKTIIRLTWLTRLDRKHARAHRHTFNFLLSYFYILLFLPRFLPRCQFLFEPDGYHERWFFLTLSLTDGCIVSLIKTLRFVLLCSSGEWSHPRRGCASLPRFGIDHSNKFCVFFILSKGFSQLFYFWGSSRQFAFIGSGGEIKRGLKTSLSASLIYFLSITSPLFYMQCSDRHIVKIRCF